MKNSIALITGATSGIGAATARLMAKEGVKLVLCGRRTERLESIAQELSALTAVHTLQFDVRNQDVVNESIASIPESFKTLDILINNAGNAHGLDLIQNGSSNDWDAMIDINVKGLLYVTQAVLPGMLAREKGHIINIGSTAGKEVYPKGNVYCASKHAVDAINQGMRMDLNGTPIRVGAVNPGLVQTEFSEVRFKGDTEKADKVYQGYTPLKPQDVAEAIWFAVTRPPHVNIADLTLMCVDQASSMIVNKSV
ncbi:SDR family NAD(P)-dependent oxidoreductase [Gilvibacter sediminis]|uniref:SDR family NAD(P)-dependent oxidoreductase n=1 Tax=Gilvibacter sediminis TaxID=379071 RepID=UPI002350B685|nr:SDR family NAD(P)-dependent oxidoreductase [Gilvibacter sediminis]MDC7996984.1 SDR family NAD(P)-dependent oxidoreductase [Gilvibacter sediminis]